MLPGSTYHLFNHANGWENLFKEHKNYDFFQGRLSMHVLPVAHIYAYCLMPNHFHLLLKIRGEVELVKYFKQKRQTKVAGESTEVLQENIEVEVQGEVLIKKISKPFSNLFNSYTQAFNKMYDRKGSLFMPNMKKEEVNNDRSFCKVVDYIHANPVHHQFVKEIDKCPHSSYKIFLSKSPTKLEREYALDIFGGNEWFIKYHQQPVDPKNKWLDS
jgi:REP element-mobilizing transposase RayT